MAPKKDPTRPCWPCVGELRHPLSRTGQLSSPWHVSQRGAHGIKAMTTVTIGTGRSTQEETRCKFDIESRDQGLGLRSHQVRLRDRGGAGHKITSCLSAYTCPIPTEVSAMEGAVGVGHVRGWSQSITERPEFRLNKGSPCSVSHALFDQNVPRARSLLVPPAPPSHMRSLMSSIPM